MLRAEDIRPASLVRRMWGQRWPVLGMSLTLAALAYGYSLFIPDQFTATTLVLVEDFELPREYVSSPATVNPGARLRTLSEQVLSRTRLERLMAEFDLYAMPGDTTPREARLATLRRRITVEVIGTEAFRISYTDQDPRLAARAANALAAFFIDDSTRALQQQVANTTAQLQDQLENVRGQLEFKEEEIRDFKAANMGSLPEQLGSNLEAVQILRTQLRDNRQRLTAAREQLDAAQAPASTAPAGTSVSSARQVARQILAFGTSAEIGRRLAGQPPHVRLEAARLQRDELLRRFTDRHPDVVALNDLVMALEFETAAAGPYVARPTELSVGRAGAEPPPGLASYERRVGQLEAERIDMQGQQAEYQRRIDATPRVEAALRDLERGHESLITKYQDLLSRNIEAELAGNLQRNGGPFASFRVVDPAVVPQTPSGPLRLLFLLAGGLAGIALVVVAMLLREMVLEPLHSSAEVERYASLPVLANIPVVETRRVRTRRRMFRMLSLTAVGSVVAVVFLLRLMLRT